VLPIRITFGQAQQNPLSFCHYALLVTLKSDITGIIPISLWARCCNFFSPASTPSYWECSQRHMQEAVEKLSAVPILRCGDVSLLEELAEAHETSKKDLIPPRRYRTTWDISRSLANIACFGGGASADQVVPRRQACHWHRYGSVRTLADRVLELLQPVSFGSSPPCQPFAVVALNSFDVLEGTPIPPQSQAVSDADFPTTDPDLEDEIDFLEDTFDIKPDAPDLPDPDPNELPAYGRAYAVNGRPSCKFHYECTMPPKTGPAYCFLHHRVVACELLSGVGRLPPGISGTAFQDDAVYKEPDSEGFRQCAFCTTWMTSSSCGR
jgi:hypothetical protein